MRAVACFRRLRRWQILNPDFGPVVVYLPSLEDMRGLLEYSMIF